MLTREEILVGDEAGPEAVIVENQETHAIMRNKSLFSAL